MRTIRNWTFETNSSSCHCVTLVSEPYWNDFKDGKVIFLKETDTIEHESTVTIINSDEVVSIEEAYEKLKSYTPEDDKSNYFGDIIEFMKEASLDDFKEALLDKNEGIEGYDLRELIGKSFGRRDVVEVYDEDDYEFGFSDADVKIMTSPSGDKIAVIQREVCC